MCTVPLSPPLRYVRSARERELIPSTPGAAESAPQPWTMSLYQSSDAGPVAGFVGDFLGLALALCGSFF